MHFYQTPLILIGLSNIENYVIHIEIYIDDQGRTNQSGDLTHIVKLSP